MSKPAVKLDRQQAFTPVRARSNDPGYEIWFAVFIEPEQEVACWIRHTFLKTSRGHTQVHLWASFFEYSSKEFMPALAAIPQTVFEFTEEQIKFKDARLDANHLKGQCQTTQGKLEWHLRLKHRFAAESHGKGGMLEKIAGVHSTVLSPFALGEGEVKLGKKKFVSDKWEAVMMHIHGWRRVDTLHWLWAPTLLDQANQISDFGLEAVSVRARPFLPPLTLLTVRHGDALHHTELIGRGKRHAYPDLNFHGNVGPYKIKARGQLNTDLKTGFIYQDPDSSKRFIVQSDVSQATCQISNSDQKWNLEASNCAAVEFHGRKAWPNVMYLDPYPDDL